MDKANSLGMYVALVAIWGKEYVNEKTSVLDTTSAFSYGKFLGTRYRDKRVIFVLGGDWYPVGTEEIWRAMAAGITAGDGGAHLKTYHPTGIQSSSRWFQNDAWLDFNMVQSRHIVLNRSYELVAQDWDKTPIKPVVEGESTYEGIVDDLVTYKPGVPIIQALDVRRVAYCSVFAGAAGYAYGSQGVWNHQDPSPDTPARTGSAYGLPEVTLQDGLQRPAGSQMQYLRALIESRPMLTRIPDQWLIVSDPGSTTDRIQATRASDGSYLFVYTSTGRPVRVRLRDKIFDTMSGKAYKAWRYDPRPAPRPSSDSSRGLRPATGNRTYTVATSAANSRRRPAALETTGSWCWTTPRKTFRRRARSSCNRQHILQPTLCRIRRPRSAVGSPAS